MGGDHFYGGTSNPTCHQDCEKCFSLKNLPLLYYTSFNTGVPNLLRSCVIVIPLSFSVCLHSVLLVFHKRPGGVYKVQKSISEREAAAKREQRTEIKKTEDEEEEEKETNPLLRHKRIGDSPYGAASIQAS